MFFVFMLLKIEQEHYDRNTKKEKTTKKYFLQMFVFILLNNKTAKKVENEHFYVFICIFAHIYSLSFCFYFA